MGMMMIDYGNLRWDWGGTRAPVCEEYGAGIWGKEGRSQPAEAVLKRAARREQE